MYNYEKKKKRSYFSAYDRVGEMLQPSLFFSFFHFRMLTLASLQSWEIFCWDLETMNDLLKGNVTDF